MESNLEIIDKGYAVIIIDHTGEAIDRETWEYTTPESIVTKYYNSAGTLQWNFYYLIPTEVLPWTGDEVKDREYKNKIILNTAFTKKYLLSKDNIRRFINNMFPDFNPERHGKITICRGVHHVHTKRTALNFIKEHQDFKGVGSFMRNYSTIKSLYELDYLRKTLIHDSKKKIIFYSHLDKEIRLAKQKFDFLNPEYI